MCGIVGYWAKGASRDVLRRALPNTVATVAHQGPDGHGVWVDDAGVGLGHARLSIIDLSSSGAQLLPTEQATGYSFY